MAGWIGVDLDGTLAHFDRWRGPRHIGLPIPAMAKRVHDWHARGVEVRIFTARASRPELIPDVHDWLNRHGFPPLAVTNQKDFGMVELWDDRAIQVLYNTGKAVRPNKLEQAEKAELFDPDEDVVYADDDEHKEVEPTEDEVANFKRNIKASSDNSLHSLDDLLDALDDGDYSPGDAPKEIDVHPGLEPDTGKTVAAAVVSAAIEAPESDLPLNTHGFVTSDIEPDNNARPKNAIVEINLDADDLNVEDAGDETAEFKTVAEDDADDDIDFSPIEEVDLQVSDEEAPADKKQTMDETLEDQPTVEPYIADTAGEEPSFDTDMDDMMDDLEGPFINPDSISKKTPSFSAFPDDDLDDLHDLPSLKVDRR